MQVEITVGNKKINFLTKLTSIFFGIFFTSLIFALFLKFLDVIGLWIALIFCSTLIFCGFYFIKKGTTLRYITWSMLISIIFGIILFFVFQYYVDNILGKIVGN